MIPLPDDPEMLAYVKQVAAEMGVDDLTAWQMIQGGEGGASPSPEKSGIVPDDATPLPAATAPGRRNRPAEVAQSPTRMVQPFSNIPQPAQQAAQQPTLFSMLGLTKEEFEDQFNKKGPNTVAGWFTDKVGLTNPEDRQDARPDTIMSALLKAGVTGHAKKIADKTEALEEENPYTITPKELKSKPQTTLAGLLFRDDAATPTVLPKKQQPTGLFSFLRGLV